MKKHLRNGLFILLIIIDVYIQVCGQEDEVIEGKRFNIAQVPYIVVAGGDRSNCTGFLIAQDWVLTSAHCFKMDLPAQPEEDEEEEKKEEEEEEENIEPETEPTVLENETESVDETSESSGNDTLESMNNTGIRQYEGSNITGLTDLPEETSDETANDTDTSPEILSVVEEEPHLERPNYTEINYNITLEFPTPMPSIPQVALGVEDFRFMEFVPVLKVIVHPDYKGIGLGNDIALMQLATKVEITETTEIIELESEEWPNELEERLCFNVGYGYHTEPSRYGILYGGDVVAGLGEYKGDCKDAKEHSKLKTYIWSSPNVSKHICYGDSGGPLICDGKVVGIASFSYQCTDEDVTIKCGREFVDAYEYLYRNLEWLKSYVPCIPNDCLVKTNYIQTTKGRAGVISLSLYAMINNFIIYVVVNHLHLIH